MAEALLWELLSEDDMLELDAGSKVISSSSAAVEKLKIPEPVGEGSPDCMVQSYSSCWDRRWTGHFGAECVGCARPEILGVNNQLK